MAGGAQHSVCLAWSPEQVETQTLKRSRAEMEVDREVDQEVGLDREHFFAFASLCLWTFENPGSFSPNMLPKQMGFLPGRCNV